MAVTINDLKNLGAANSAPTGGGDLRIECFSVELSAGTDVTVTINAAAGLTLSHVYGAAVIRADTTDAATADTDFWQVDLGLDSSKKSVVPTAGVVLHRTLGDTGGALIAGDYLVTLIGY